MKNQTNAIWKALADPNRREILDLLRESAKTTGELNEKLESIGRCAVMKHLNILENANLVIGKKEGKFKWNHINPIPLQQVYERWVKNYEAQWASNLLNLKSKIENNQKEKELMENTNSSVKVLLEIPIEAKIETVWNSLISDVNQWWRKDFYTSPKTKAFIIEPKVGGRMYEDYGNNEGLLWSNVIVLDAPNVIEFKGHLTPEFGGPAISFLRLSLKEENTSTILTVTDTVFGIVSEKTKSDLESGWKLLFEDSFKSYIEK